MADKKENKAKSLILLIGIMALGILLAKDIIVPAVSKLLGNF